MATDFGECDTRAFLSTRIIKLDTADLLEPPPGAEVILSVVTTENYRGDEWGTGDDRVTEWSSAWNQWLVVCGLGASGVPACTPQIRTATGSSADGDSNDGDDQNFERTVTPEGDSLVATAPTGSPEDWRNQRGRHRLVFP